jgi:hypothetical protein
MSSAVLKWPVSVDGERHAVGGGPVMLVASQGAHGTICVWTLEHSEEPTISREVIVVGTGHDLPDGGTNWDHIGSCLAGPYVWHVFEQVLF